MVIHPQKREYKNTTNNKLTPKSPVTKKYTRNNPIKVEMKEYVMIPSYFYKL